MDSDAESNADSLKVECDSIADINDIPILLYLSLPLRKSVDIRLLKVLYEPGSLHSEGPLLYRHEDYRP